jgi:hypothetical protein
VVLTRPASRVSRREGRLCWIGAVVPTARVAHPGLVVATVVLAAVPALVTLGLGGDRYFEPMVLLGLVSGAALGWAADDPSAELLASAPVAAPLRRAIRAAAAALLAGLSAALVTGAVAVGPGLPPTAADRIPEGLAAAAIALAAGHLAGRRGDRAAGAAAVTAGILASTFVAMLAMRLTALPSFMSGPNHDRWWLVAVAAGAVALHAGRDPGRR